MKNIFRVIFISSILLHASSSFCDSLPALIEQQAEEITTQAINKLLISEQIILANFLYVNFVALHNEHEVYNALLSMNNHQLAINKALPQLQTVLDEALAQRASSKKLIDSIASTVHALTVVEKAQSYISQKGSENLKTLLEQIENYAYQSLIQYASNEKEQCERSLEAGLQILHKSFEHFYYSTTYIQSLLNHKSPSSSVDENVATLNGALTVTDKVLENTNAVLSAFSPLKKMSVDIVALNKEIFATFYKTLLKKLHQNRVICPLLFDKNGHVAYTVSTNTLPLIN